MVINVKKSAVIRIGPRFKASIKHVLLCSTELPLCTDITYLGVEFCAGRKFRISTFHRRMKFFRAFNAIYAKTCGSGSEVVTLHLTRSFCLPILIYGLDNKVISS